MGEPDSLSSRNGSGLEMSNGENRDRRVGNILSAILRFLSRQTEVLHELAIDNARWSQEVDSSYGSWTQASRNEGDDEVFLINLGEPIKIIWVGEEFSLLLEFSNRRSETVRLEQMMIVTVIVEGENGEVCLSEIESIGVVFFKRLVITQKIKSAKIVIKANADYIRPYIQTVIVKERKRANKY